MRTNERKQAPMGLFSLPPVRVLQYQILDLQQPRVVGPVVFLQLHADVALRLLQGERLMEPSVVFQANFPQGSGVHTHMYDSLLGSTYFCYSSHMDLYEDAEILGDSQEIILDEFLVC